MRYTLEQAQTDESLPFWWTEKGCPDWARCDDFRDIPPDLQFEVRRGLPEAALRKRISDRKSRAKYRAKKAAAETPEQKAARELRARKARQLARLTSAVKMHERRLAEALEVKQKGRFWMSRYCERDERSHIERAQKALAEYVEESLREELAQTAAA